MSTLAKVEWNCPVCGQGYVGTPDIIEREKAYHKHEDQHGQICGGCGADIDREDCDYEKHAELMER